jgi:predicted protein tyrosine phosphatase
MSAIIVCPLAKIAELSVRHKAREMVSLIAEKQDFHRPAVIAADRHLKLAMNDITFAGTGNLIAPNEAHVERLITFMADWDRAFPLVVHCWMGVSRSPAAALIAALAVSPQEDEFDLTARLRTVAPHATPNTRLVEIGDRLLNREGRLVAAVKAIGRGADTDGTVSFILPLNLSGKTAQTA